MLATASHDATLAGDHVEFVFPRDLFEVEQSSSTVFWTCVRVRPRWEKKLCRMLRSQAIPHYMPVSNRQTYSGRKLRSSSIPLFPGFVFVPGNHTRGAFTDSGCVTSVLKPTCPMRIAELDSQIRAVHRMLTAGTFVGVTTQYEIGEHVTINSGPMRGLSGVVTANSKRLVLWIDMLGVGAFVQLGTDTALARVA